MPRGCDWLSSPISQVIVPVIAVIAIGMLALAVLRVIVSREHGEPHTTSSQTPATPHELNANPPPAPPSQTETAPLPMPAPQTSTEPATAVPATLEFVVLPVTLVSTEAFSLLDIEGKETVIPAGSVIKVLKRGKMGSLTTEINKGTFVGNESRLAGKVNLR